MYVPYVNLFILPVCVTPLNNCFNVYVVLVPVVSVIITFKSSSLLSVIVFVVVALLFASIWKYANDAPITKITKNTPPITNNTLFLFVSFFSV